MTRFTIDYIVHSDGSISISLDFGGLSGFKLKSGGIGWPSPAQLASGQPTDDTIVMTGSVGGTSMTITSKAVVKGEGTQSVSVPAGRYSATVVDEQETKKIEGTPVTTDDKTWLVNGVRTGQGRDDGRHRHRVRARAADVLHRGLSLRRAAGSARIEHVDYPHAPVPTFLFDLDGTLIDSVYQHVIAWRAALSAIDIDLSVWRIHRRIGMSGGLFVQALLRETDRSLSPADIELLQQAHAEEYRKQYSTVTALPGARELLAALTGAGVRWGIATSGYAATARPALELLGLPEETPMVTRDLVRHAKPDPDLFLAAAALLGVDPRHTMVVGDSVWDLLAARRAGALGIGLQSGGYGREELERAGAYRVYADPAEMLARLDEAGVRLGEAAGY